MSDRRRLLSPVSERTESPDEDSDEDEPQGGHFSFYETEQTDEPQGGQFSFYEAVDTDEPQGGHFSFMGSSDEESEDETTGGKTESSAETLKGQSEEDPSMSALWSQLQGLKGPSVRPKVRQPTSGTSKGSGTSPSAQSVQNIAQQMNVLELYGEDLHGPGGPPLHFKWDHFGSEFKPAVDVPGLEYVFGREDNQGAVGGFWSVIDDVEHLKSVGYIIDYPNGLLGEGMFGAVYSGHYGPEAKDLPELSQKERFAVKVVDFGTKRDQDTLEKRERYETEKYILTNVHHRNIVAIRMIINMGNQRSFAYLDNPQQRYISPERVYLFMDYSDVGELESYLHRHASSLETYVVINFIRDLFAGMLYLHSNEIFHGDVHTGNVLLFKEGDEIVAKWADFGLGYVGANKQYRFKVVQGENLFFKFKKDLFGMDHLFTRIIDESEFYASKPQMQTLRDPEYQVYMPRASVVRRQTSQEERRIYEDLNAMLNLLKTADNLMQVYEQYRHILEEELVLESEHY